MGFIEKTSVHSSWEKNYIRSGIVLNCQYYHSRKELILKVVVFYAANNLPEIWQKGESQNGGNKQKVRQISEKQTSLTSWYVHV